MTGHRLMISAKKLASKGLRLARRLCGRRVPITADYPRWIRNRIHERRQPFNRPTAAGLFSILTPVFNTPPQFLQSLGQSVLSQDYADFEWVIVDNGSTIGRTRAILKRLARDQRVRLIRLEKNHGIIGGTRIAFEAARNRYVVPVDHDDLLYPDALRIMAVFLEAHDFPAAAYSDEDKATERGQRCLPFFKPDWDPILFLNCCYTAHLTATCRETAAKLDCYTDPQADGCPDWDTMLRLVRAGHEPIHVPEILYSWRMHRGSTACAGSGAKPFTLNCQYHVLTEHLRHSRAGSDLDIRTNPFFGDQGMWHAVSRRREPTVGLRVFVLWSGHASSSRVIQDRLAACRYPGLHVVIVDQSGDGCNSPWLRWTETCGIRVDHVPAAGLSDSRVIARLKQLEPKDPIAVLHDDSIPLFADWPWEAVGMLDGFADVAVVGGPLVDSDGKVESAGQVFGYNGMIGSPLEGHPWGTPGPYGFLICQRSVSAVDASFFVARAGFLASAIAERSVGSRQLLAAWLGAAARRSGLRVVYSPYLAAERRQSDARPLQDTDEAWRFLGHQWHLLIDDPFYSPFLSLRSERGYQISDPQDRAAVLWRVLSRLAGPFDLSDVIGRVRDGYVTAQRLDRVAVTRLTSCDRMSISDDRAPSNWREPSQNHPQAAESGPAARAG